MSRPEKKAIAAEIERLAITDFVGDFIHTIHAVERKESRRQTVLIHGLAWEKEFRLR